jgi:hypothetical protein
VPRTFRHLDVTAPVRSWIYSAGQVFGGLLTVQEHFFRWQEGQRYSFYVTEANAPFFKSLAEDYNVEPDGPNHCGFTWSIALEPTALGRIGAALNRLLFNRYGKSPPGSSYPSAVSAMNTTPLWRDRTSPCWG